ncbi:uncharacterized protein LOC133014569 [Limanda limanda]|uniref:uncharacterized protein LOC133014569 n=1 Tax=Limanda limanda TaxID=27771 RepID=UPI0029C98843|nr:uncharacterized protein LOC133014569 [Limanda limanda]
MTELLRLQENNQLPSSVSGEDMMKLIEDQCKSSLRVQNWQRQLEEYKDPEFLPQLNLYNLVWEVSNSLKKRDIEFEARQFLKSRKTRPPHFSNPVIIRLAQEYSSILKEQQKQPLTSKRLGPLEVVLEVAPKVLQGFWLPPEDTCLNMPSQHLSVLAVSLTKAVDDKVSKLLPSLLREVSFSRSTRDKLVQSIQDNVRTSFTPAVLMEKISCFAVDLMNCISTIASNKICELFQPQISTKEPNTVAQEVKKEPHQESAFTPPPPAPPVTPPAEPAVVLGGEGLSQVPTIPPDTVTPVIDNMKTTKEKSNAPKGIYKPIKELFQTPIYEVSQQCCWQTDSYIVETAVMTELLRLQENNQLPSSVSGEDMMKLIEDRCKSSRMQYWEFQLEPYYNPEFLPQLNLYNLVWEVSNSLRKRDIEFEARQFLKSPKTRPPKFRDPGIISFAQEFSSILKEQQKQPLTSKRLGPLEVVLEVAPKVLQGFWLPPEDTCLNMPSQHLSVLAVSLTQAVDDKVSKILPSLLLEVSFTRSTRDKLVKSIQDSVRRIFTPPSLMEKISCFAVDLMNSITTIASNKICELFQPQISTKEPNTVAQEVKKEPHQESAFTPPPPASPTT